MKTKKTNLRLVPPPPELTEEERKKKLIEELRKQLRSLSPEALAAFIKKFEPLIRRETIRVVHSKVENETTA